MPSAVRTPGHTVYVALDLETTGLNPDADDVIEVGAVKFDATKVIARYTSMVNPGRPIPSFVQALTGILPEDVAKAPQFPDIVRDLQTFIGAAPLVGHNIEFDKAFVERRGVTIVAPAYDTFDLATVLLPSLPSYSLAGVAKALGLSHQRPHRALHDAEASAEVFVALLRRLMELPPPVLHEIRGIAGRSDWPLRHLLQELVPPPETPVEGEEIGLEGLDLAALAERLSGGGALHGQETRSRVDSDEVAGVFDADGPLAAILEAYESREEQLTMARKVAGVLNDGGQLVAEAGTGTGKSLAYLVPAALFAQRNGERVLVSTNTINLQEQLIEKDIPTALRALEGAGLIKPGDVRYSLLKGRGNYLCLRRWSNLKRGDNLTASEARLASKLLVWLQSTKSGDRNELNLGPRDGGVWPRLSAQGYDDQTGPCPFARRGLCFYQAARRRAEGAHVVVANHALLSLGAVNEGLLPHYRHLIVDEAHNLEEVATNQWGFVVDEDGLHGVLDRISGGASVGTGLLAPLTALSRALTLGEARRQDLAKLVEQAQEDLQRARSQIGALFHLLASFADSHSSGESEFEVTVRLTPAARAQPAWSKVEIAWEDVNTLLERTARHLEKMAGAAERMAEDEMADREGYVLEAAALLDGAMALKEGLKSFVAQPEADRIYWISVRGRDKAVRLNVAPLQVGPDLDERLFASKDTLVLTSATLSTEGNLEFIKARLSLDSPRELVLGSPFDYPRLVLACMPREMPPPGAHNYQAAIEHVIAEAARGAGGRTLVLFTGWASLRAAAKKLQDLLVGEQITVLAQGNDGTPSQLVERLRETPNVVLLGTGSFWEGVDIAGDALSVLIIAKLPFSVPTDPIFAARSQQFEDSFNEYALPHAVLRFKQGFGRLIRRKTDRGVLLTLDRRIVAKAYGTAFWDSIPRVTRKVGPFRELRDEVSRWLSQQPLPLPR